MAQASSSLEEAGRSLGRRPVVVWWRVTLPLLAPGLGAAFALVFISAATELTATLLLHPTGVNTLATQFWAYTSDFSYGAAAPYAALMVAISAVPAYLLSRRMLTLARMGQQMSELTVTDLWKGYSAQPVLRGMDLDVPAGSLTAVLGLSGCGKTTLLRVIAGFERAERGRVSLGSRMLDDEHTYVPPEQRGIGYVPQEGALFPHLTVKENIGFGLSREERRGAAVGELLEMVGLAPLARSLSRISSPAASSSA